jgi:hypothetical protein
MMMHYLYNLDYPHVFLHEDSNEDPLKLLGTNETAQMHDIAPAEAEWEEEPTDAPGDEIWGFGTKKSKKDKKKKKSRPWTDEAMPDNYSDVGIAVPNLIVHAQVYALAEKYSVDGLKELALEKFEKEVESHWNTDDFLQAAEVVYTSTVESDRGMRDIVLRTFYRHHSLLGKREGKDVVKNVENIAYDLVIHFWEQTSPSYY